ncbi:MAG: heme ABC transporter ATP-binding protein [Calditrichaeota bacterium]|nr:heme ABC transporter ATP-binding protein [Calditrichota bacterium]
MIEINEISVQIDQKDLVRNCSAQFASSSLTAIVGQNGSGKSTLLKSISGLITPTHGSVRYNGKNLQRFSVDQLALKRAVFSQGNHNSFPFTVEDLVAMGRSPHFKKTVAKTDRYIVDECIDLLELNEIRNRNILTLSGGEQQRAHIARVIAQLYDQDPAESVYIFDEPTNNLDVYYQYKIMHLLADLRNKGFTILVALHDLNLVSEFADQVIVMKNGEIYRHGSADDVLNNSLLSEVYQQTVHLSKHPERNHQLIIY